MTVHSNPHKCPPPHLTWLHNIILTFIYLLMPFCWPQFPARVSLQFCPTASISAKTGISPKQMAPIPRWQQSEDCQVFINYFVCACSAICIYDYLSATHTSLHHHRRHLLMEWEQKHANKTWWSLVSKKTQDKQASELTYTNSQSTHSAKTLNTLCQ